MSHLSTYLFPLYVDFPVLSNPIMSKASTVTALVAHHSTLGNEDEFGNCICILVATHGNGTMFSHDSFQEEDLVATHGNGTMFSHDSFQEEDLADLCLGLGQAYLEGVLQISETKALLTFSSITEQQL